MWYLAGFLAAAAITLIGIVYIIAIVVWCCTVGKW